MNTRLLSLRHLSLFTWLMAITLLSVSLVLAFVGFSNRLMFKRVLLRSQDNMFTALMRASMEEIEAHCNNVEEAINQNALEYKDKSFHTRARTVQLLDKCLQSHELLCGAEVIFTESAPEDPNRDFTALYVYQQGPESILLERDAAQDRQEPWYQLPILNKSPVWSEPYIDSGSQKLMITYSIPLMDEQGNPYVILTGDIALDWLDSMLKDLPVGDSGEPILLSAQQRFLVCGNKDYVLKESLPSLAESCTCPEDKATFERVSQTITTAESGRLRFKYPGTKEPVWCYFNRHPEIGLTLACVLPEKRVHNAIANMTRWIPLFGLIGLMLMAVPAWGIARSVARPLSKLRVAAAQIAQGNFQVPLPPAASNGEISSLISSFDKMRIDLSRYVDDLTETTAARERLAVSLRVAHDIQLGMVPKDFSAGMEHNIDLYATMKPAQEVGGDLYDFAFFDKDRFYFCIGDVSGKGVPASLFMAVGKTLLKSLFHSMNDPGEAMTAVNRELIQYNPDGTSFITALAGYFCPRTGDLVCAYAGHNPPVVLRKGVKPEYLRVKPGLPLAIVPDYTYVNEHFHLDPGDALFLYTDGVTEAMNPEGECYGEENLLAALEKNWRSGVQPCTQAVLEQVQNWANGSVQSDDITMLMFVNNNETSATGK
ncbi:MAG: SpoIIE family protein phosphatase [Planctomycetia bacterium]|nr:SpoIIE family protein phosphatase [Planctomycetia bacterium]